MFPSLLFDKINLYISIPPYYSQFQQYYSHIITSSPLSQFSPSYSSFFSPISSHILLYPYSIPSQKTNTFPTTLFPFPFPSILRHSSPSSFLLPPSTPKFTLFFSQPPIFHPQKKNESSPRTLFFLPSPFFTSPRPPSFLISLFSSSVPLIEPCSANSFTP